MKYIKGNIIICDNCDSHILIENIKNETYEAWNWNHTKYLRYVKCPCCNNEIAIENN